jgi:DNA-binding NtrC family response regulator
MCAARVPGTPISPATGSVAVDGTPFETYRCVVRKILILDEDTSSREALVAQLRQTANADVVLVSDAADAVARLLEDGYAAILIDTALTADGLPCVLAAVRRASWRPLVVLVTEHPQQELDPDLISLVVRKPYEVPMVTGILLAAITDIPQATGSDSRPDLRG